MVFPLPFLHPIPGEEIRPSLRLHHRRLSKAGLWAPQFLIPAELSGVAMPQQCVGADLKRGGQRRKSAKYLHKSWEPSEQLQRANAQAQDPFGPQSQAVEKKRASWCPTPTGHPGELPRCTRPLFSQLVVCEFGGIPLLCCGLPTHVLHLCCTAEVVASKVPCK